MINTITRSNGAAEPNRQVSWIQSVSHPKDHAFRTRTEELTNRFPKHVRTATFYTRLNEAEVEELRKPSVEQGGNENLARLYASRIDLSGTGKFDKTLLFCEDKTTQYYLCGPDAFTKSVEEQLTNLGVDEKRVHREVFVA